MLSLAFWVLAMVGVAAALMVVLLRDIFRAALFLVLCFFAIAGIYITLSADFLAAVQVLVYVGAIAVLLLFAIMLTREAPRGNPSGRFRLPALLVALLLLGSMVFAIVDTAWSVGSAAAPQLALRELEPPGAGVIQSLAAALLGENGFVLPLEIAAVLLLAAVIGAITLAREK